MRSFADAKESGRVAREKIRHGAKDINKFGGSAKAAISEDASAIKRELQRNHTWDAGGRLTTKGVPGND
jgi:hypothetical protein